MLRKILTWLRKLFSRRQTRLALYGPPNGGKTTLANRICADWLGEEMGSVSRIAHETRRIQLKQGVKVVYEDGRTLTFSLVDTPGISSRVDAADFVREGLSEEEAKARAKEAAQGVVESIEWIGNADCVVVVLDATKEPRSQVSTTLVESLVQRGVPFLIAANKVDLKKANVARVQGAFAPHEVLGISAKYGDSIDVLYERLFELASRGRT
jgi:GTPase